MRAAAMALPAVPLRQNRRTDASPCPETAAQVPAPPHRVTYSTHMRAHALAGPAGTTASAASPASHLPSERGATRQAPHDRAAQRPSPSSMSRATAEDDRPSNRLSPFGQVARFPATMDVPCHAGHGMADLEEAPAQNASYPESTSSGRAEMPRPRIFPNIRRNKHAR